MVKLAVIGGTGVYDPRVLNNVTEQLVETTYGSVKVTIGEYAGQQVAFIPRHGQGHSVPPHKINYRANIMALKQLGVEKVIATAAVGSLNREMEPGQFVVVDQFIDFTKNRISTFFEGGPEGVVHVDMSDPYCGALRKVIMKVGQELAIDLHTKGTYVCTEGPRFETPAEIRLYGHMGGDLVGMTSCPEVVLAKEAEMCYATVATVTNFAAGVSNQPLTHAEVVETMQNTNEQMKQLIMKLIEELPAERECACPTALSELGKF